MSAAASSGRTQNYYRQIWGATFCRGAAVAISFVTIPLAISYLGQEQFGIWSTLLTVMSWAIFFDLGIGNGLRNKVAELLAKNDPINANRYISSSYILIGLIALTLWAVIFAISFWVPWQNFFNTDRIPEVTLRETVQIAAFFLSFNFWLGLITALLGATQKTALISVGQLVTNLLIICFLFFLAKFTHASIKYMAFAYGISIVSSNIALSIWFYWHRNDLRPSRNFSREYFRPLLSVGVQFFAIQVAFLVIFTADKMLITQLFGPQYVAQYDIVFKLFSVVTLIHGLISVPLWSAYTDAHHRNDIEWMRNMLRKQIIYFLGIIFLTICIGFSANSVIVFWVGDSFLANPLLLVSMGLFVLITTWLNIFSTFLNGVQKIKISLMVSIASMLINIPVSIILAKFTSIGVSAVIFGTVLALLPGIFLGPYQTLKIISQRDIGIWAK